MGTANIIFLWVNKSTVTNSFISANNLYKDKSILYDEVNITFDETAGRILD